MSDELKTSWQVPVFEAEPSRRLGYIEEQIQEGEGLMSYLPCYKNLAKNMQIFDGVFNDKSRSTLNSNFLKYNIRKFVETISDVREIGLFGSDAPQYKAFAEIENRVARGIYQESQFPRQLRRAVQYAAVMGAGYLWPKCKAADYGWGERRIIFEPLGPLDVLPVQVPSSGDIQEAYLVTIFEYMPIAEAHGRFPLFQSQLKPIDQIDIGSRIQARRIDFQEKLRYGDQSRNWGNLYAIDIDEIVPTPTGWSKMGELKAGDYIFGGDGSLCKVLVAHPMSEQPSYKITFGDGSTITASEDHQWLTSCKISKVNHYKSAEKLRTTKEIYETRELIHRIESSALDMPESWLPIDPYLLGLWLGDGCKTSGEIVGVPQDLAEIEKVLHSRGHKTVSFTQRKNIGHSNGEGTLAKLRIEGFERSLRTYGILHNKRIPMQYLRASFNQRLDLLKGLMDTDGWVNKNGNRTQCGWGQAQVHKLLVRDMSELLNSLGIKNTFSTCTRERWGKEYGWNYTQFDPYFKVFNLPRKKDEQIFPETERSKSRYISDIEPVGAKFVRCITVNSNDHTFLVGRSMIRTHNCEIRYTFIRDLRLNTFGKELPMGEENTSWFYKVPYVGQDILGGYRDGQPFMRKATKEDCRVYPYGRLIISNKGVDQPMYDGPAFEWHGQIPAVQYSVDDWPWMMLGYSLVDNVGSIEQTKRKHERKIDQILSYRTNPAIGYDRGSTGGPKIENFDIFEENVRLGVDGKPKEILQALLMDELNIDDKNFKLLEILERMEKQHLGIEDLGSLMNLKLNVSSDGFDKALESVGPIAKGIATSMEASNAKIAYMLKFMIPQWFNTKRIIEYTGPDETVSEFFDFDPESMIPSHMPEEMTGGMIPMSAVPNQENPVPIPSKYSKMERARRFAQNLRLISVPSTLMKITAMQDQLKYLQLYRGGFPISPHTVAKKLDIPNYGEIGGNTEFEKWQSWEKLKLLLMAEAQQMGAELGIGGAGGGEKKPHAGGRPPSGQKPPKLAVKGKGEGNPRTVVKESR